MRPDSDDVLGLLSKSSSSKFMSRFSYISLCIKQKSSSINV
jgi:hypothetical protein